jgi:hypothetical protein
MLRRLVADRLPGSVRLVGSSARRRVIWSLPGADAIAASRLLVDGELEDDAPGSLLMVNSKTMLTKAAAGVVQTWTVQIGR